MIDKLSQDLLECRIFYYLAGIDLYRISWLNKSMRNRMRYLQCFYYNNIPPQNVWPVLDLSNQKIRPTFYESLNLNCKLTFPSIRVILREKVNMKLPRTSNIEIRWCSKDGTELLSTVFNLYRASGIEIFNEIAFLDTLLYLLKTIPLKKLEILPSKDFKEWQLDQIILALPELLENLKITMFCCETDYGPRDGQLYRLAQHIKHTNLRILNIQSYGGNIEPLIDVLSQLDGFICPFQSQSIETTSRLVSILPSTNLKRLEVSISPDMVCELLRAVKNSTIQHLNLCNDVHVDQYCKIVGENMHLVKLNHLAITTPCYICSPGIGPEALETILSNLKNADVFEICGYNFEKPHYEVLVKYLPHLQIGKLCLRGNSYQEYLRCFTAIPIEF
ncbi:hypothetical protein HK103_003179 [Boothiomyces macroporosus]|uniref:Uncharacterized protein n=1 Tax=Boothiomyces macroporosus TaxID=261099 RepID=A0AAD5UC79_9FUNG|nr:hypothetical protein HK103_003179 [Boothiomyces macroporosus]